MTESRQLLQRCLAAIAWRTHMDARAINCVAMALDDIGTTDADVRRVLLDHFTLTTTRTMAAYPRSRRVVPEGLRLPRWSWTGLEE